MAGAAHEGVVFTSNVDGQFQKVCGRRVGGGWAGVAEEAQSLIAVTERLGDVHDVAHGVPLSCLSHTN